MSAPSFIQEAETALDSSTSPKTTASFSVQTNDVLVAVGVAEDSSATAMNIDPSGGSLTWNQQEEVLVTDYSYIKGSTAIVDSDKSMTVDFTRTAGASVLWLGGNALTFRGSDGVGAAESTNVASGAPSLAITTTQDNSAIVVGVVDWAAVDGASRTWRTVNSITPSSGNGYELTYFRDGSHYAAYIAYYPDAGAAGSKTVGLSAPSGQKYAIIAIEIKGTAGGTVNTQTLTDNLSVSDAGLDYVFFNRLMESILSIADGAIRSQIFGAHFTDTLTIDEQSGSFMVRGRVAESFINITDESLATIVGNNILTRVLSSSIDITDGSVLSIIRGRLLQDTIDVTEPGTETFTTTNLVVTDEVTADDSIVTRLLLTRLLGDSIDLSDSAIANIVGQNVISKILSSTILTSDEAQLWLSRYRLGESTILTTDQIQAVLRFTRLLEDAIDAADESQSALKRFILLTDALAIDDSLFSLIMTPTTDNPIIRIGFDQPRIELGGYVV